MKRLLILLGLLFCAVPAFSQNTAIVATIKDPSNNPYAFATGSARIVCPGNQQPTINGSPVINLSIPITGLDGNGHFTQTLLDVNTMVPVGCAYVFAFTAQDNKTSFTTGQIGGVTGAGPVDLSAAINAYAVLLPTVSNPASLGGLNTWTQLQTFNGGITVPLGQTATVNGALTVSGTGTFSGPLVNTGTDSGNQTISGNKTFTGTNSHSGTETSTGPETHTNISKLNNIFYVDGTTYVLTDVGVNAAIAAASAQGGGKVIISKPVTTTANINLASKVHVECTDWESAPITWAGGAGPNAIFVGGAITDASVRYCNLKGPNLAATPAPTLTTSTSGGSLGAGVTVFVKTTYVNAGGETLASTESSITTGAGSTNSVTVQQPWVLANSSVPPVPATGYTVYSSTTTGTEKQQAASNACVNITTTCVIQSVGAGASAPNTTTAAVNIDLRGIEIDGLSRSQVEYNKITGMSYCIFETSGGQDMDIQDNFVQSCTLQGVVTYDAHVRVTRNRIDTIGTSALHHGVYVSGGQDQNIAFNQISNVYGFCVQGFASVSPQINAEIKIIGNGCEVGGQAPSSARGGVIVGFGGTSTAGSEYLVQGNTIANIGSGSAIQVGDGRNFVINGNIIRNHGVGDMININSSLAAGIQGLAISGNILDTNSNTAGSGNGIVCSPGTGGVKNVTITGNQLSSIAFHGIKINGCLDGTITGNQVFNFNLQNASANGIDLESGATAWTIGHNRARSTAATGFAVGINTGAVDNIVVGDIDLNAAGTYYDNGTRTLLYGEKYSASNTNFLIPGPLQNVAQTAVMGLTLKKGSGGGNYTNATTSYAVADSTNLCFTVTIPTGWKLGVSVSGALSTATAAVVAQAALTDNAACSTANAGILVETAPIQGAAIGVADTFALNWVITGDGNAHNVALQFKTSNASDTASLINSSATITPTMKFELMPSN